MRILIIDDDSAYCNLLRRVLEDNGHGVSLCHEAASGLMVLQERKPDFLILDVHMPQGGGKLVYQRVRTDPSLKDLPIIVATASTSTDSIYKELESEPHPKTMIVRKPIDLPWLSKLMAEVQKKSAPKP